MICLRTTLSFTWIPHDLEIAEMVAKELLCECPSVLSRLLFDLFAYVVFSTRFA